MAAIKRTLCRTDAEVYTDEGPEQDEEGALQRWVAFKLEGIGVEAERGCNAPRNLAYQ